MQRIHRLAIVALFGCGSGQQVAPEQPSAAHDASTIAQPTDTGAQTPDERKALMRQFREARETKVRERGEIFARIAVKHDYSGEYVLFRDQDVTAFPSISRIHNTHTSSRVTKTRMDPSMVPSFAPTYSWSQISRARRLARPWRATSRQTISS
jgi:hypothetical protein